MLSSNRCSAAKSPHKFYALWKQRIFKAGSSLLTVSTVVSGICAGVAKAMMFERSNELVQEICALKMPRFSKSWSVAFPVSELAHVAVFKSELF